MLTQELIEKSLPEHYIELILYDADVACLRRSAARPAIVERLQQQTHLSAQRSSRYERTSSLICCASASTAEASTSLTSLELYSVITVQVRVISPSRASRSPIYNIQFYPA